MNTNKKYKKRMEKTDKKTYSQDQQIILAEYNQAIDPDNLNAEPIIKNEFDENTQIIVDSTLENDEDIVITADINNPCVSNKAEERRNLEEEIEQPFLQQCTIQEPITQIEKLDTLPVINVNETDVLYPTLEPNSNLNYQETDKNLDEIKFSKRSEEKNNKYLDEVAEKNYIKLNEEFTSEKSQVDRDSFDSRPNSILEFFSSSRQDNAKRIQSQIVDLQTNALCYTKSLIKLTKDFYKMKMGLNSTTNNILNYLFSLFGYTYRSNFQNANLFIFSTQSWLIILGTILESKIRKFSEQEKQNFKYSNLLEIIRTEMQQATSEMEEAFLNNLGIFTGNLLIDRTCSSTTTLIENNIGRSFMKFISESIKTDEEFNSKTEIDKKQFEDIIMNLLQKSVEATLNIEFSGEDKEYIDFIHLFDELKCEMLIKSNSANDIKITFDDYFEYIINSERLKRKNISGLKLAELKICAEAFYIFSQARIYEIILDAKLFIRNYSSIVYKTKRFADQSLSRCINLTKKAKVLYDKFYKLTANPLQMERISDSFSYMSRNIAKKCAIAVKTAGRKLTTTKAWLNDSYSNLRRYKPFFIFTNLTSDLVKYSLEAPQVLYEIVIEKCNYGYERYKAMKHKIYEIIFAVNEFIRKKLFTNFREYIYVKEDDSDERFVIVLNRRLMNLCPVLFVRVFESIRNLLRNSYDIAKSLRMSIISKYKRLLCADADRSDINSDCNLVSLKKSSCELEKVKVD